MILQKTALKKGQEAAGHNIQSWAKRRRRGGSLNDQNTRYFASGSKAKSQLIEDTKSNNDASPANNRNSSRQSKPIDRDFFLSVLGSSATKRDARSYLQAFTPPTENQSLSRKPPVAAPKSTGHGVNLGGFDGKARAVAESPKFVQPSGKLETNVAEPPLHVALVKIRSPQDLDNETLDGVGKTLSQLGHLGLISTVVVDCGSSPEDDSHALSWRDMITKQTERIVRAIDIHGQPGARVVDNAIGVSEEKTPESNWTKGRAHVNFRKLLMTPLRRGVIPVIPALGYTDVVQTLVPLSANEVVLALTRELAGLQPVMKPDTDPMLVRDQMVSLQNEVSLDRLIVLDPLGGIPTSERPNGYHVFLNMEQEYEAAKQDLIRASYSGAQENLPTTGSTEAHVTDIGSSNPFSKFVESNITSFPSASPDAPTNGYTSTDCRHHLENLDLVRKVLSILPPTSSALLTTPDEAANSGKLPEGPFQATGVGTRRKRNPLIHNLLTDKPAFSSSLPVGRLGPAASATQGGSPSYSSITPTTFAKHGMSVTIFPDPKVSPWEPPGPENPGLRLTDPRIDLPRLVHLIEDSFDRKLDVQDFLKRIDGRIAGVIVAGEYEGGALLTWELPPGVPDDGSPESRARMVPYLDKFAVLKRSQGSGGVADIVFTAMVRDCFPNGVCWRSRRDNPVNKWYFERSRGTWKLAHSNWTMFWTTPDGDLDKQKFLDYEGVCRGVQPSWADNKALVD
ncbi:putative amino-acid acetyltransferase [Coleophoma cylindrospora]|uniref:Amino-acid acetyltransferase, mitochondrial n=1 Tax=Coleophoma cylindrospora TaxID=1849047 RepID=A0A3D8S066_9HELO|nr:putative amino-acid acetyltransferase [Coleophoma cylindrospora]